MGRRKRKKILTPEEEAALEARYDRTTRLLEGHSARLLEEIRRREGLERTPTHDEVIAAVRAKLEAKLAAGDA